MPSRTSPPAVLLLAASLLLGAASAGAGDGTLDVAGALALDGAVTLAPGSGALVVQPAAGVRLDILASRATVHHVTWTQTTADDLVWVGAREPWTMTTSAFEAARLVASPSADEPRDGSLLALQSGDLYADATRLRIEGGTLRGITEALVVPPAMPGAGGARGPPPEATYQLLVADVFRATTSGGASLDVVAGSATLYLLGLDLVVTDAEGRSATFRTGESTGAPADGSPVATERTVTYVLVELEGLVGAVEAPHATASWYAAAPNLAVDGAIAARAATGALREGARQYDVDGRAVTVAGLLQLAPVRTTAAERDASRAASEPGAYSPYEDPGFRVHVAGDIHAVSVASRVAFTDESVRAAAVAGVAGLALVVVFWETLRWWAAVAALPLYSRLREPQILDNAVRNQIYTIIRQTPGISARAIQRSSGQSWGTVVYHLRQLERHHLVTSRRHGRARNYYENHGKYRGMEVALATLNSPRALAVARAIAQEPGLTQERLTTLTSLPQPTASYYVRKLKDAKLIAESRHGRYARYEPAPELVKLLAAVDAERAAAAGAAAGAPS